MSFALKTSMAIASLSLANPDRALAIAPNLLRHAHHGSSAASATAGQLDLVMVFGATAVLLMLFCRAHEHHYRLLAVGTAIGAMMAAIYGFMVGAWPLGIALGTYSIARSYSLFTGGDRGFQSRPTRRNTVASEWNEESRIERMFGRR